MHSKNAGTEKLWRWVKRVAVGAMLFAAIWCVALLYSFGVGGGGLAVAAAREAQENPSVGVTQSVAVLAGHPVKPAAFLADAPENAGVSAAYGAVIDFVTPGRRDVPLVLTQAGQSEKTKAALYVLAPAAAVSFEAGVSPNAVFPEEFLQNADILEDAGMESKTEMLTDLSGIDFMKIGRHEVRLTWNGVPFDSALLLVDTTPPGVVMKTVIADTGYAPAPEDFIVSVADISPTSAVFADGAAPDPFAADTQMVAVEVSDIFDNSAVYKAQFILRPNLSPPVFTGLVDIETLLGDPVKYRYQVTAADSFGNPLDFTVDSGAVDTYAPGVYEAVYRAQDANGHETVETRTVTVSAVSAEDIGARLDEILAETVAEDMDNTQKARAIFDWISAHVGYTSTGPKDSVYEAAYQGLRTRSGDCFTFYALSELLLTRAGIENMRVTRTEGASSSRHYWNLINPEGDGWVHFDTTPTAVRGLDRFMFTQSQAQSYTERIYSETRTRNYYQYDAEKYPAVIP